MADNRNDKELEQGKLPVFEVHIPEEMEFVFGIDEVYPYEDTTILMGQVFRGKAEAGAVVSYGEVGPKMIPVESFACLVSNVQAPNEKTKSMEPVRSVSHDSALNGRCALIIADRDPKSFRAGGLLFATKVPL